MRKNTERAPAGTPEQRKLAVVVCLCLVLHSLLTSLHLAHADHLHPSESGVPAERVSAHLSPPPGQHGHGHEHPHGAHASAPVEPSSSDPASDDGTRHRVDSEGSHAPHPAGDHPSLRGAPASHPAATLTALALILPAAVGCAKDADCRLRPEEAEACPRPPPLPRTAPPRAPPFLS